jgi:hypothetical protein
MSSSVVRMTALIGAALVAAGCAAQAGGGSGAPASSSTAGGATDDGLVLQVAYTGGFVTPETNLGRLPLVSVYADGRIITEGPVAAIYPGPALPNLQVAQVSRQRVEELVDHAFQAGIGQDNDYGTPSVADVPSTRFTIVTTEGTQTAEVYALAEGLFPEGDTGGLTEEQVTARRPLLDLLDELTTAGGRASESYVPEAVAVLAGPWVATEDEMPAPEPVAWPGPPLPGEPVAEVLALTCVTADGEDATAVLEAAATANARTPWTTDDGSQWSLTLRPLLPHETSCADLPTT